MLVGREQLHAEVWTEPMTTVAKRYGVSSSFLARVCERLGVPRPPRGFWAQRVAGLKVDVLAQCESLPAAEPGSEIEWARDGEEPRRQPLTATEMRPRRKTRGRRPEQHPLLVGARAHFDHARESRDEQYVRPYKRNLVDVFVSKEALERALRVSSDLFLALEDRGQRVMLAPSGACFRHVLSEVREGHAGEDYSFVRWTPGQPTISLVGALTIGLTIFEVADGRENVFLPCCLTLDAPAFDVPPLP